MLGLGFQLGLSARDESAWRSKFDSASGVEAALVLDYAGAVGGRFFADGDSGLTFDDIHAFTRASEATHRNSAGLIVTAASGVQRLDHDKDGNRIGLLVEVERENLALQSNGFDTTWAPTNAVALVKTDIGPDGLTSMWKLQDDSGGASGTVRLSQGVTVETSTVYIYSVFAKADQLSWLDLRVTAFTTPANSSAYFNLATGVVGTKDAGYIASGIEDYDNGIYRCWVAFTTHGTDTTGNIRILVAEDNGDNDVALDGSSSILIYGAHFEKGTVITSYIPTTTLAVTREAEVPIADIDGLSFDQTGDVSIYIKARGPAADSGDNLGYYLYGDATGGVNSRIELDFRTPETIVATYRNPITSESSPVSIQETDMHGQTFKVAHGCSEDDFALSVNGGTVGTDSSLVPVDGLGSDSPGKLTVGHLHSGAGQFNGHIAAIAIYASRLTNADLEAMATL